MKFCERCQFQHDGKYASGRFCSVRCAHSFSTSKDRKRISQKIRDKLTVNIKRCKICNEYSASTLDCNKKLTI